MDITTNRIIVGILNALGVGLLALIWNGWVFVTMWALADTPSVDNPKVVGYMLAFAPWLMIAACIVVSQWLLSRRRPMLGYLIALFPLLCELGVYRWW